MMALPRASARPAVAEGPLEGGACSGLSTTELRAQLRAELDEALRAHTEELLQHLRGWTERQDREPSPPDGADSIATTTPLQALAPSHADLLDSKATDVVLVSEPLRTPARTNCQPTHNGGSSAGSFCVVKPKRSSFRGEEERKLQAARLQAARRQMPAMMGIRRSRSVEEVRAWGKRFRDVVHKMVTTPLFDHFFVLLIGTNAIVVGLQVDSSASGRKDEEDMWNIVQCVYCMFFLAELLLRIVAFGPRLFWSKDCWWNYLDLVIVAASCLEFGIEIFSTGDSNLQNLVVVRMVRFVRIVRVIRVIRLLRFMRSLRVLIHSIFGTLKSLIWAQLLLWGIMYSFGVVFTQAAVESPVSSPALRKYFGTLPRAIFTLFKAISGGVSWEIVVDPISDVGWFFVGLFILYIIFALFAVLNVMTGHFCQAAIESADTDHNEVIETQLANSKEYTKRLQELFHELDPDGSGEVTLASFEKHMCDPRLKAYCETLDIEIPDAWTLFKLLDKDGSHAVNLEEFVQGCVQIRGYAKTVGVKEMMYEMRWMNNQLTQFMEYVGTELTQLTKSQCSLHGELMDLGRQQQPNKRIPNNARRQQQQSWSSWQRSSLSMAPSSMCASPDNESRPQKAAQPGIEEEDSMAARKQLVRL